MSVSGYDPEMLSSQDKIRYAEKLIRGIHKVLDDDYLFWGAVADDLNNVAHIPDKVIVTPSDWRRFNRAVDAATGFIRMMGLHYYYANDHCRCGAEVVYHEDTEPPGDGCSAEGKPWANSVKRLDPNLRRRL